MAPSLAAYDLTPGDPHDDPILLPSSFTSAQRESLNLEHLARNEIRLRVGHAHDLLERLRKALGVRSLFSRQARVATGYRGTTRQQEAIRRAQSEVNTLSRLYRRVFRGLQALNPHPTDLRGLQGLENGDLVMLSDWVEDKRFQGSDRQPLPWIWRLLSAPLPEASVPGGGSGPGAPGGAGSPEAIEECIRVAGEWNEEGLLCTTSVRCEDG